MNSLEENPEIEIFREYLRIPSVYPNIDYDPCVKFLKKQADSLELPMEVLYPATPKHPVVVISWIGEQPNLPSILLNSHMDVVPVFPELWTHPPFSADMDIKGNIYARGAQDMKSVGMQYLGAIRALKKKAFKPKRTIHVSFVPEEELGGFLGMQDFVKTKEFQEMNIGFSMDEGIASPNDVYPVFYAERSAWHLTFKISGPVGHGSLLLKNTVGEKLSYLLNKMMNFRIHELQRLESDSKLTLGDVTTVNLTKIKGGVQTNVIPPIMEITFDIRIANAVNHDEFEKQLLNWCQEAGGDIELDFEEKMPPVAPTKTDESNVYWKAFRKTADELGLQIQPLVYPAATDSAFIRKIGIPAIGFSPMNNTPVLLHDHDEYLNANIYLKGIDIYEKLILALASLS